MGSKELEEILKGENISLNGVEIKDPDPKPKRRIEPFRSGVTGGVNFSNKTSLNFGVDNFPITSFGKAIKSDIGDELQLLEGKPRNTLGLNLNLTGLGSYNDNSMRAGVSFTDIHRFDNGNILRTSNGLGYVHQDSLLGRTQNSFNFPNIVKSGFEFQSTTMLFTRNIMLSSTFNIPFTNNLAAGLYADPELQVSSRKMPLSAELSATFPTSLLRNFEPLLKLSAKYMAGQDVSLFHPDPDPGVTLDIHKPAETYFSASLIIPFDVTKTPEEKAAKKARHHGR